MKILVIGSGGREHALVWKLSQSKNIEKIYVTPGNGGMAQLAEVVPAMSAEQTAEFARKNKIDLTVVGPEQPLVEGIVDLFVDKGLMIFGPSKKGSMLEGSKYFAKDFMEKFNIPTAKYKAFNSLENALSYLNEVSFPVVVKADGLAAGKGVIIAQNKEEAENALKTIMQEKAFGGAGSMVVVEEFLKGEEISVLALVDGKTILPLESSQDHKRIFDNDEGPNTGGMGAVSPSPLYTEELKQKINQQILQPVLKGLQELKIAFHGILYAGLMIDEAGNPYVLEFNVRFGDPEAQAVLARLETDFCQLLLATCREELAEISIEWKPESAVCVVMASGGYPCEYEKGKEIFGLDLANTEKSVVFHAGTEFKEGKIVTSGGRVLGVTALGADLAQAKENAYQAVEKIKFDQAFYRKDIGNKAIQKLQTT